MRDNRFQIISVSAAVIVSVAITVIAALFIPGPVGADTLFWDFEAGPSGFQGEGDWEWGVPAGGGPDSACSGENCWGTNLTGFYSHGAYFFLETPGLKILSPDAALNFASWFDFQAGEDGGNVQISLNEGATWWRVDPIGGYPDSVELGFGKISI